MREYKFMKADKVKALAHLSGFIDEMKDDREYILTVKQAKRRRSLNANNYAWALMDKLAEAQSIAVTEIYRTYVKDVGGNMECATVSDNAVTALRELWESKGIGWQTEAAPTPYEGYMARKAQGSGQNETRQRAVVRTCFLCGCNGNAYGRRIERHHIFGGANRALSERYRLVVDLCHECHNEPPLGAHHNAETMLYLHRYGQRKAMDDQGWTAEQFAEVFGKNYL